MKKVYVLFFGFLIFFPLLGNSTVLDQDQFVDTYAFNSFFNHKGVLQQLHSFLSPSQIKKIKNELTVQSPIKKEGQFLIIKGCRPHLCPFENYILFINLKEKKGYLGLWASKWNKEREIIQGNITFYGSHLSEPLVFKDLQTDLGCHFPEDVQKEFIKDISLISEEHGQKEALRKLIQNGLRVDSFNS